jgi:hypothetical protein
MFRKEAISVVIFMNESISLHVGKIAVKLSILINFLIWVFQST